MVGNWALTRFGAMGRDVTGAGAAGECVRAWGMALSTRLAYVGKQQLAAAERELEALRKALDDETLKQPLLSPSTARAILAIGPEVLAGEIAASRGQFDQAISHLETAVRLEDALVLHRASGMALPTTARTWRGADRSRPSSRGRTAVSDADLEPVAQVCGRPVKGSLNSVSQDPVASCRVDHLSAGWMFWFPRKTFVGSYFCLSAASRW